MGTRLNEMLLGYLRQLSRTEVKNVALLIQSVQYLSCYCAGSVVNCQLWFNGDCDGSSFRKNWQLCERYSTYIQYNYIKKMNALCLDGSFSSDV